MMDEQAASSGDTIADLDNCFICKSGPPKYKCPTCFTKYCSANCYKDHKTEDKCQPRKADPKEAVDNVETANTTKRTYFFPTKDTVSKEKLEMLSTGENLLRIKEFLQDPAVRLNVLKLDKSANPMLDFQDAMDNENFVKFSQYVTELLNAPK